MYAFGSAPGSSALMNPGFEGNSFSTHRSFNSFTGQYLPNSPGELSPTFMPKDPTTGTLETLVTVSKGAKVVTLPATIIFQSASTSENAVLYTSILPLVETGEVTTFLKEFIRYPAMPLRQASDLATPHFLHRSSWQTATTTFRFNIGNKYSMERLKEAAGQQELVRDAAQIAMSFQQHIVLLAIDGLKMAHKPLIEQRRAAGKYDTEDVLSASEFQVMHFCAVQKSKPHAWTSYIQAVKEIMLRYDGSPTTLVTDVKIKPSFVKDEYTKYMETGEPSLANVRNPAGSMSRATPVDNIVYLSFIPERLASKQSPMHELTQIGGWHPGFDVPVLLQSDNYAETYVEPSRSLQIYDPELNSFVTISLSDMVENAHMFDNNGRFKGEIFDPKRTLDKTAETYVSDLYGVTDFKNGSGTKSVATMKFNASVFLKSIGSNFARWCNKSLSELAQSINDGVELYVRMAKSEFNAKTVHDALKDTLGTKGLYTLPGTPTKSLKDILDAIVDEDIATLKWHMNDLHCNSIKLDEPLANVSGFLSWRGFETLYDHYSKKSRSDKDKADREWVVLVRFVEAIKQLVAFINDYLPSCALIKRVKYDPGHALHKFEKTSEESLCDQLWNFNATFPILLHKGSFLQFSNDIAAPNNAQIGGVGHGKFVHLTANNAAADALAMAVDVAGGKPQTDVLRAIYDRLIQMNFADHLNMLKSMTNKTNYKKIVETIGFDAIKPNYIGKMSILPSLPVVKFDADFLQNNKITITSGKPTDLSNVLKQSVIAEAKNLPHVSKYRWLLVNNWKMNALLNYLIVVYTMINANTPDLDKKIKKLSDAFATILKPLDIPDETLPLAAAAGFPAHGAEINTNTNVKVESLFTGGKNGKEVYDGAKALANGTKTAELDKIIPSLNKYWMHKFTDDADEKIYKDATDALTTNLEQLFKQYDSGFTMTTSYGDSSKMNKIENNKTDWLDNIPMISQIPHLVEALKKAIKTTDVDDAKMVVELVDAPTTGPFTKELMALLHIGADEHSHFLNKPYYGEKTRFTSAFESTVTGNVNHDNMGMFDNDVDTWVRTPFRVSRENAQHMFKMTYKHLNMEMRIEYVERLSSVDDNHRMIAGNPFASKITKSAPSHISHIRSKEEFESKAQSTDKKPSDQWSWHDLPFLSADKKCKVLLNGVSLKTQTERHYYDLLFGLRLYDDDKRSTESIDRAWTLLKSINAYPSHCDLAMGMVSFMAVWNKQLSDIFIDRNVFYPIDFMIFRPWINLLTVLGFLLRPGVDALGFISTSHADKMSSATAIDKTGIVHCSIWCGVVFNNPANVKKVPNLSCIGFGAGGGSGFYSLKQIQNHLSHKEYKPIEKGTTSPSLIVAAIPKGSTPKRTMVSLVGYIPDNGNYVDHGLVLNESERAFKDSSEEAHYPTAKYYRELWKLLPSGDDVGASLNMDAVSTGNNLICHLGTTRYYNPKTGGFDYIILNTGHFGPDEGPGCKEARMTGTPFPTFNYASDPHYKVITV